jgi:hypothetical protein
MTVRDQPKTERVVVFFFVFALNAIRKMPIDSKRGKEEAEDLRSVSQSACLYA